MRLERFNEQAKGSQRWGQACDSAIPQLRVARFANRESQA